MLVRDLGEFELIKRLSAKIASESRKMVAGIGDDAAALYSSGGKLQLVTTDMLVEDVHFRTATAEPFQIGWKSLAVNISDIAAMGGEPTYAFVSLGLPRETVVEFVDELYAGMDRIAKAHSVDIVGGDTVSSPKIVINITLLGEVDENDLVLRSGAMGNDAICVTGDLGGSAAGLAILQRSLPREGADKHLMPVPRICEGKALAQSGFVTAMIDISDGLASEIHHICEESNTGARLFMKHIPLSGNIAPVSELTGIPPYDFALYGGEDYELLFTCPADKVELLSNRISKQCGTSFTVVGRIEKDSHSVTIETLSGEVLPLAPRGYDHFTPSAQ